jgi:hypothetical protein
MTETARRNSTRPDPVVSWTVLTDGPLRGLSLAREPGIVLAWDETDHLYLFDALGERLSASRAPEKIIAAAASDSGSLFAVLVEGPRIWLLGPDLEPLSDRPVSPDSHALAIDPHGRYVAVSSKLNQTQFINRHGRAAGKFETLRPLSHLHFVANQPMFIGASTNGWIVAMGLEPGGDSGSLRGEVLWQQQLLSNVGRLEVTGDGGMILASCFNHGVQRYDLRGQNEGAYHLGGTASHAVPDFAGRTIVVSTQEGEIALLNQGGNVRWRTALPRSAIALEMDALGRYFIYGLPTGEIRRLDLDGVRRAAASTTKSRPSHLVSAGTASRSGSVRSPAWLIPVAQSDEQAETTVVTVLDDPARIGVITNQNRLQVVSAEGETLGEAPQIIGVGRVLATAPGWIAASTDRMAALYDVRRDSAVRLDLMMHEMTHMVIRPDTYGLAFVQERDRLGRVTPAARWIWKRELRSSVEGLAISAEGLTAVTCDNGELLVFDPAGEPAGSYQAEPEEPLCLIPAPRGAPEGVEWITLARRFQILRGHLGEGRVVWETPVPWESWQLHRVGAFAVAVAPDGRAIAFDGSGNPHGQSRVEESRGALFPSSRGDAVLRVVAQGEHLICSDLGGRVRWRAVADATLGPMAAGRLGVATLIGRNLAWFPNLDGS